jgi:hypothetical protein
VSRDRVPGILLIAGSVLFLVGAAVGVPAVFAERDPGARLRLLRTHLRSWRAAQPLYGLGPLLAAAGVGGLSADAGDGAAPASLAAACVALVAGALAWAWSLYLRAARVEAFAFGTLPGWPFATYVLLTIAGLALLGAGLLAGGFPGWLGWLPLAADLVFLAAYLRFRDLPRSCSTCCCWWSGWRHADARPAGRRVNGPATACRRPGAASRRPAAAPRAGRAPGPRARC